MAYYSELLRPAADSHLTVFAVAGISVLTLPPSFRTGTKKGATLSPPYIYTNKSRTCRLTAYARHNLNSSLCITHRGGGLNNKISFNIDCNNCNRNYFISPSMYNRVISTLPLVRTVILFLKCPGNFPLPLYVTSMLPFCPGAIGRLSYWGTVHPQLATT